MKVQEKFLQQIPVDSVAGISAANLLGDKFLNITKGPDKQTVKDGAEIPVAGHPGLQRVHGAEHQPAGQFQAILKRVDAIVGTGGGGQGQHRQAARWTKNSTTG